MVKTTVYLPEGLKRRLEQLAGEKGRKEAELIREAVQRLVDAEARPPLDLPLFSSLGDPTLAEIERYRSLSIGLADASLVVLADRYGTNRLLTLDERRFRAVRPLGGGAFRLLPTDA